MTNWSPIWKLTINGVNYTTNAISTISHASGRRDIYQQPTAGYLQIELLDLNGLTYNFNINDIVSLSVKDSTGTYKEIFGGSITDVSNQVKSSGSTGYTVTHTIIALGAISKLNRALTYGALAKDFDGNQIKQILSEILFDNWTEVSSSLQWSGVSSSMTWAQAFNSGYGEVDTPGDYELTARSSSQVNAYSLISDLARSGLGYIYENGGGKVAYADSTHRVQYLAANGYTQISANQALSPNMSSQVRGSDLRNQITLTYKANASVSVSEAASIASYGTLAENISTSLENVADATSQANFYLSTRAYPQQNFNSITFALQSPELSDATRDALIKVFMGMPIDITDLPPSIIKNGRFQGFVEGWSFTSSFNSLYLTLYLSPLAYSIQSYRWNSVAGTKKWNNIITTTTWNTATIVA